MVRAELPVAPKSLPLYQLNRSVANMDVVVLGCGPCHFPGFDRFNGHSPMRHPNRPRFGDHRFWKSPTSDR